MNGPLVTLVDPNLVHPPITPSVLDILTTSLEAAGFDVDVLDLTLIRDRWRGAGRPDKVDNQAYYRLGGIFGPTGRCANSYCAENRCDPG